MIRQLVALLSHATWTDLTRLETKGDNERLSSALRILVGVSVIAVITLAGVLWFDIPALISAWTHGRIEPDVSFLRLMLLQVIVQTLWVSASNIPAATNRHRSLAISYIVANTMAVVLSGLLLPTLGLNAIPISFIASELIACVHFVLSDACRIVGMEYRRYIVRVLAGSTVMSFGVWILAIAIHATVPLGLFARVAVSLLLAPMVAGGIAWNFLFTAEDRRRLVGWARKILPQGRVHEHSR
jgi:O-antigen/teichoic acid export membrane protein